MTTKRRLLKKISAHLRAAGIQRHIQRRGAKIYTTAQLVLGLAVREAYRLSYRRAADFLDEYYSLRLHWTTLQKAAARLPMWLWHKVLASTAPLRSVVAAVDGTGYARRCPSEHYLKRIDGKRPSVPIKLSVLVDTESRRVLSARVRMRPAHDIRDVRGLLRRSAATPLTVLGDKGYDAQHLHQWLDEHGIRAIIPTRKGCRNGRHRQRMRDRFPRSEYGERNIVEAVFKAIKTRFGGHVRGRTARSVRAEVMVRLILHNIKATIHAYFLLTRAQDIYRMPASRDA